MKPEKAYPKKIKSIRLMYVLKTTSLCRCKTDQALKSDGEEVREEEEKQGATAWAIEDGRAREVAVAVVSLGWPSPHSQARLQAGEADGFVRCGGGAATMELPKLAPWRPFVVRSAWRPLAVEDGRARDPLAAARLDLVEDVERLGERRGD
jgi:hypothetical protein